MKLSMIVAVDRNNAIGKNNELPWRLPADLANFKALTMGKSLILGRKTWDSLGRKPLPGRDHYVITRRVDDLTVEGGDPKQVVGMSSIKEALLCCREEGVEEVFIIGGAEIYHQTIKDVDRIYLSRVDIAVEGADAFFPEIDRNLFQQTMSMRYLKDGDKHTHDWYYQIWDKEGI